MIVEKTYDTMGERDLDIMLLAKDGWKVQSSEVILEQAGFLKTLILGIFAFMIPRNSKYKVMFYKL